MRGQGLHSEAYAMGVLRSSCGSPEAPGTGSPSLAREGPGIPPVTERALAYTWSQLLVRAGWPGPRTRPPFTCAGVDLLYQHPEEVGDREDCMVVAPCRKSAWGGLMGLGEDSVTQISIQEAIREGAGLPFADTLTVLLWGMTHEQGAVPSGLPAHDSDGSAATSS